MKIKNLFGRKKTSETATKEPLAKTPTPDKKIVREALACVHDPIIERPYGKAVEVRHDKENANMLSVNLRYPIGEFAAREHDNIRQALIKIVPQAVLKKLKSVVRPHKINRDIPPAAGVKNIIAVASGKGGVGKSTVTVMLAKSLQGLGARVGILDADIYGPSMPRMLGDHGKPAAPDEKSFQPVDADGIQSMSLGYMMDESSAAIWRGAMVSRALMQMMNETRWDKLDYLLIDLPPGTGDIQLTLVQKIPVTAAVIVTTPQDIALIDAQRAWSMFNKVDVPVLGVIENMSTFICPACGHESHIFGHGAADTMAHQFNAPVLGRLPLNIDIRTHMDDGTPEKLWRKGALAGTAKKTALRTAHALAQLPVDVNRDNPLQLKKAF